MRSPVKRMSLALSLASGAVLAPPAAPVISLPTSFSIGETITWPAVSGATSYNLYRDGVLVGAKTSPYTIVAADVGPAITVTAVNGAGESAASNTLTYSPTTDANLIEAFVASDLADGAVASWAGRKGACTLAQGTGTNQPTKSTSSGVHSVAFDGNDILSGALNLSAYSAVAITGVFVDAVSAAQVVYELTANASANNGGLAGFVNDQVGGNNLQAASKGTGGTLGEAGATETQASPVCVTRGHTTANINGTSFIASGTTSLSLTNKATGCATGNYANSTFYVGARSGIAAAWTGTIKGAFVIVNASSLNNAVLTAIAYCSYVGGL